MLPRLALLAAALAMLVAGCGTDKKAEYRQDFQRVAEQFRTSVEKAGAQVRSGATLKERVPALRIFKASVEKLAADLDKLDPPDELKKANADAVRQLRTLASDLSDYEAAAMAGDQKKAAQIVPKLQADQTLLQKTLDELDRKVAS